MTAGVITPSIESKTNFYAPKARMGQLARIFIQINPYRPEAGMKAVSHFWSMRRMMTARVLMMAVAFIEINFFD